MSANTAKFDQLVPVTRCNACGAPATWEWEDAFLKFGYGDGDGVVMTEVVAERLRAEGFTAETACYGPHNTIICSLIRDGVELVPDEDDNPRTYLPDDVIQLLDDWMAKGAPKVIPTEPPPQNASQTVYSISVGWHEAYTVDIVADGRDEALAQAEADWGGRRILPWLWVATFEPPLFQVEDEEPVGRSHEPF